MGTRSRLRNANRNRWPKPQVIERAPEVVVAPEPITIKGVQAMIRAMIVEQRKEMRKMLLSRDEPIVPVIQPELNEELSGEGKYSPIVSQVEPRVVRRNNQDEGIQRNGCNYKDLTTCKPSTFIGKEDLIRVMDWIIG